MQIAELTAYIVQLPLRREIKHASASRRSSENLIVRCRLADGTEGWGEGVPREYVTGETCEGAIQQLDATPLAEQLCADCDNWQQVIALCDCFAPVAELDDPRGCASNALRCGVELSILDAFGRLFGRPLSQVTAEFPAAAKIRTNQTRVRYSGAIMAEGRRKEATSAIKMRLYGFAQCKIKVGVTGADDALRLRRIRRWIGRKIDLRLDANEAWHGDEAARRIEPLMRYNVSCIEQPVPHEEVASLATVRREVPLDIMLDESLCSLADARTAIDVRTCTLFNIRLSKCGGYLNSLRLAALAREHGLGYQLGCHPGESGILSAAGRHWAATVRDIRYIEGSYDRHVLSELITAEDLTFGYGGWAPALSEPGLGITIERDVLERLTTRQQSYRVVD